jgi:hypothetical protein
VALLPVGSWNSPKKITRKPHTLFGQPYPQKGLLLIIDIFQKTKKA